MKIAVYTVALNECHNVKDWARSAGAADYVMLADTGSTDGTPDAATRAGIHVSRISVKPWRFDVARNAALALLPADVDICIALDMDERLSPGWRAVVEAAWTPETLRLQHRYIWSHNPDGSAGLTFDCSRIHARHGFVWRHPCHEELYWAGEGHVEGGIFALHDALIIEHFPDPHPRDYLPLLKQAYAEETQLMPRAIYYLGREYYNHEEWVKAQRYLIEYLHHPLAHFAAERSQACIYLARCHAKCEDPSARLEWARRARFEDGSRPEAWYEEAFALYELKRWQAALAAGQIALELPPNYVYYAEFDAQRPILLDIMAECQWSLGHPHEALSLSGQAVNLAPNDERIRNNLGFYIDACEDTEEDVSCLDAISSLAP